MDFTSDTSFEHGLFDFTVYSENSVFAVKDSNLMFVRDIFTFEGDSFVGVVSNCPDVSEVLFFSRDLLFRFSLFRGSFGNRLCCFLSLLGNSDGLLSGF